jgi:hypothetical protein
MRWFTILCIGLLVYGGYNKFSHREVRHPIGVMTADQEPQQSDTRAPSFEHAGYTIKPLADFSLQARVLSAEHYGTGRESDLSPVDLAMGWGRMSDSAVLKQLQISQSGRFYFWRFENQAPIPVDEIISHSANMHMIPANPRVETQLKSVRPGEIVTLSGYLVEASASDGWHWKSSLTRKDAGAGACEVIWVKEVSVASH